MGKVKLLDCTLRDGGYINDWEFGIDGITSIINKLEQTGIEIIEVGFIKGNQYVIIPPGGNRLSGGQETASPVIRKPLLREPEASNPERGFTESLFAQRRIQSIYFTH